MDDVQKHHVSTCFLSDFFLFSLFLFLLTISPCIYHVFPTPPPPPSPFTLRHFLKNMLFGNLDSQSLHPLELRDVTLVFCRGSGEERFGQLQQGSELNPWPVLADSVTLLHNTAWNKMLYLQTASIFCLWVELILDFLSFLTHNYSLLFLPPPHAILMKCKWSWKMPRFEIKCVRQMLCRKTMVVK